MTAALSAVMVGGLLAVTPGTAGAGVQDGQMPGVRLHNNLPTGATYNKVYGTLDPAWRILSGDHEPPDAPPLPGDEDYEAPDLPEVKEPPTPPIAIIDPETVEALKNTVYTVVNDPQGAAMKGVTVVLTLINPTKTTVEEGATVLAETVTDEAGRAVLLLDPAHDELMDVAEYGDGVVNLWLSAVKDAPSTTWSGTGAIYTSLMDYGGIGSGLVFAPVNVGVMTVYATNDAMRGPSLPPPHGDPAPYTDRPDLPADAGSLIDAVPVPPSVYVETPDLSPSTDIPAPAWPQMPNPSVSTTLVPDTGAEVRPSDPGGGGGGRGREDKCRYTANQSRWFTESKEHSREYEQIGEVHGWLGTRVKYTFSGSAKTEVEAKISTNYGKFEVSGETKVTNNASSVATLPYLDNTVAHPVEAEFDHVREQWTWCPHGYDAVEGPYATHQTRVFTRTWSGGLQYNTAVTLGGDGWDEYKKARSSGRSMTMQPKYTFQKTTGKTYRYGMEVGAFGVTLAGSSQHGETHKLVMTTTERLADWHAWGNKDVPPSPSNNAIYVSG